MLPASWVERPSRSSGGPTGGAHRRDGRVCRGAGGQRSHRRLPPLPDPRRPAHHPGAQGALPGLTLAYGVGDGANNMAPPICSVGPLPVFTCGSARPAYQPKPEILARAQQIAAEQGGSITITDDPIAAVLGADVVATDTWCRWDRRASSTPARARRALCEVLGDDRPDGAGRARCHLPALSAGLPRLRGGGRGDRRTPVGGVGRVEENRLHAQKAVLSWLVEQHRDAVR